MHRLAWSVVSLALLTAVSLAQAPAGGRPVVTVGIVYDGPPADREVLSLQRFMDVPERIRSEIASLTRRQFDVRFPADKRLAGDWNLQQIRAAIDRQLADPDVDLVLTLGVFSSNDVCRREGLSKPVVAPFAVDASAQSLPLSANASGVPNLNYLIRRGNVLQDLRKFQELVPFGSLHVLVDSLFLEALPEVEAYSRRLGSELGVRTTLVPVHDSAESILNALDGAEALYVTPLLRLPAGEFDRLVAGLIERRLPSFSLQGQVEVERGLMAGLRRATDASRVARRVALNVQRILLGEDAGTLPVTLEQPEKLLINYATMEAVGVSARWRVILEADAYPPQPRWGHGMQQGSPLSLSEAVLQAVRNNVSLQASERSVEAALEDIRRARARLLPALDAEATSVRIDEDRAAASFGSQPERALSGGISGSQLLWSDAAWAGRAIARHVQTSRDFNLYAERLDVALDTATAFLNILRARILERVENDTLDLTESNLELARRREAIGFSGPADVYRWEAERATARSDVIKAHTDVHAAYVALNRLLHRPLEDLYELQPPDLADSQIVTGFGRLNPYIDNVRGFDLFREFSVQEGQANSPELRSLDAMIAAKQREVLSSRRSFWSPDLVLAGEWARRLSEGGAGADPSGATGLSPGLFEPADRNSWSLALNASLPLFAGGARKADARQVSAELSQLRLEREALEERIELRIRAALFGIGSSFPTIGLAREAADAARRNLELVTDAYSRGAVSIIDLLDAQNAAVVADEFAANAVYDFLIDLMECQRATGDFDFFRSVAGRQAWFSRLDAFFTDAVGGGGGSGR